MTESLTLTAVQQSAAIDRADCTLALQSGAGCGKTLVLSLRLAQLLREQIDTPDALTRLVAITFTDKAAIEMQQRVRRQLIAMAKEASGPQRQRLLMWIQQLPDARISTIHSFCASLLRRWAVEAGIDPAFSVCADDLLTGFMITDAAEQAMLRAVQQNRDRALNLLAAARFNAIRDQIVEWVRLRGLQPPENYLDPQATFQRWSAVWQAAADRAWSALDSDGALSAARDALAASVCTNDADRLLPLRDRMLDALTAILDDPSARTPKTLTDILTLRTGNVGSDKHWGGKGAAKTVRHQITAIRELLEPLAVFTAPPGDEDHRSSEALAALAELTRDAIALYDARKRTRGLLDFDDLLIGAHRLLSENETVRKTVGQQVRQFLVDECQDTDAMQFALLNLLVSGQADDPSAGPEGKLFMVGDAKQSIYRFRGAQVEVYQAMCDRLGEDRNAKLDISFRTHGGGIAFINHLFGRLMGGDYDPITAHRTGTPPHASVEILLACTPGQTPVDNSDESTTAQAALTAEHIGRMLDDGHPRVWDRSANAWRTARPGDIAILFARMTESLEYERQLAARDIPYYVVAGTGFFQQQEVFDVLSALQAVDNPYDDIAFIGLLRSGMIALDDHALMRISRACKPPYFPALMAADRSTLLDRDDRDALETALAAVDACNRLKDAVGPDAVIERLLSLTGYEATLLAQGRGTRPLGNVRMLIDRARAAASDSMTLADFIRQCDDLVLSQSRYEQAAVAAEGDNVVRLMTIHKAKGLEFPVVVIPDLNAGRRNATGAILNRSDTGLVYKPATDANADNPEASKPASYQLATHLEQIDAAAEDIRQLYVAVTRHQDHLVLIGADWRTKDGHLLRSGSPLQRLDAALNLDAALARDDQRIDCGGGHHAVVRRVSPEGPAANRRESLDGWKLLAKATSAADLSERIASTGGAKGHPPLLGPVPADVGRVDVAVTALGDFAWCPMLYRWRYELRVPADALPGCPRPPGPSTARDALDAATLGTLLHRCMELLDFSSPQEARTLVARAAAEMGLPEGTRLTAVVADLDTMLQRMSGGEVWNDIASARKRLCELDFEWTAGAAVLRGQIDLLYQDSGGQWHIVDYKSDRVSAEEAPVHAQRYALQMAVYAAAARRFIEQPAVETSLYFLRSGASVRIDPADDSLTELISQLLAARRSGEFPCRDDESCRRCGYRVLCHKGLTCEE